MRELYIRDPCIEVARRCNMRCTHCMRRSAEPMDIPLRHIGNLLRRIRHTRHFNTAGGEPSPNVRAIHRILERVHACGVTVNNFYIVVNGSATSRSEGFIKACTALYEYQEEKKQDSGHMLGMSDDRFHGTVEHTAMLATLSPYPFFEVRGQAERIFFFREDRSTEGFSNPVHGIYFTEKNYVYGDLCLNTKGMILSNRDLSYVRRREYVLYPCGKLMQYLRMTLGKRQRERLYK